MNGSRIVQWFESYLEALSGSVVVTFPRVATAMIAMLVVVLVVTGYWERRLKILPSLVLGSAGLGLLILALDPDFSRIILKSSFLSRIRFLMGFLSISVLAITFESIRISRLRERFALLWLGTGAMVLLAAIFPEAIDFLTRILGMQYVTAVAAAVFTFLLLVAFHFSIALSGLEDDRSKIAQRCAQLELRLNQLEAKAGGTTARLEDKVAPKPAAQGTADVEPPHAGSRSIRGVLVSSRAAIGVAFLAVCFSGLGAPGPTTGEAAAHFQVIRDQALGLPAVQSGGWHYMAAIVYRAGAQNSLLVNLLQSLFWLQFLIVVYGWAAARRGKDAYSPLLSILVLASIPLNLVFPLAWYPDVALIAQLMTTFYLLDRRRLVAASLFMLLAVWISDTAILFAPPFFILGTIRGFERKEARNGSDAAWWRHPLVRIIFLPVAFLAGLQLRGFTRISDVAARKLALFELPSEAFFVNSGILIWLVVLAGVLGVFRPSGPRVLKSASRKQTWPLWVVGFVVLFICFRTGHLPAARALFLLTPFLVVPFSEWAMRISTRGLLILATVLALLQGGLTLGKNAVRSSPPPAAHTP